MDNTKKINRWLSQILHCHERGNAIVAEAEQAPSAAYLAHCHERLEFFAAREQVLQRRLDRLRRQSTKELEETNVVLAHASMKLLDTIHEAVRLRGKLILTKKNDGGVQIEVPFAEKKKSS